jgi:hypothetical protein
MSDWESLYHLSYVMHMQEFKFLFLRFLLIDYFLTALGQNHIWEVMNMAGLLYISSLFYLLQRLDFFFSVKEITKSLEFSEEENVHLLESHLPQERSLKRLYFPLGVPYTTQWWIQDFCKLWNTRQMWGLTKFCYQKQNTLLYLKLLSDII